MSFGPGLIENGKIRSGIEDVEVDTNFGNHSIQGQQPRTGIGLIADNHLPFVAVDGRSTGYSRGVTMTEMAQIFLDRGATVAYNLDGGGSTAMVFNGDLVNNPLGRGQGTRDQRHPLYRRLTLVTGQNHYAGFSPCAVKAVAGTRLCRSPNRPGHHDGASRMTSPMSAATSDGSTVPATGCRTAAADQATADHRRLAPPLDGLRHCVPAIQGRCECRRERIAGTGRIPWQRWGAGRTTAPVG